MSSLQCGSGSVGASILHVAAMVDSVEPEEAAAIFPPITALTLESPIEVASLDSLEMFFVIELGQVHFPYFLSDPIIDIDSRARNMALLHAVECTTVCHNSSGPIITITDSIRAFYDIDKGLEKGGSVNNILSLAM